MNSISSLRPGSLEGATQISTTYRHVLRVSAEDIPSMSRDELVQLCLEQYSLLILIVAIIRNTQAELATRVVMVDYLIDTVHKCVRKSIKNVTERTPILLSGEVKDKDGKRVKTGKIGIAERVGVSNGTVSAVYSKMEAAGLLKKDYRTDDGTRQKRHIDVTMQPAFLLNPVIEDRKPAEGIGAKTERKPKATPVCPKCGSFNCELHMITVCRDCNEITDTIQASEPVPAASPLTLPLDEIENEIVESTLTPVVSVLPQAIDSDDMKETERKGEAEVEAQAKEWLALTEQKREPFQSENARTYQVGVLKQMIVHGITKEQYVAAYDERNDTWWRSKVGPLAPSHLWAFDETGEHRIFSVLTRLKEKSPASREHSQRLVQWNGREVSQEQAHAEGYLGGFERYRSGDHPDDDLEAAAQRLLAEGKLGNWRADNE